MRCDQYLPLLRKAGAQAVTDGTANQATIDEFLSGVSGMTENALTQYREDPEEHPEGSRVMVDPEGNRALVGPDGQVIRSCNRWLLI